MSEKVEIAKSVVTITRIGASIVGSTLFARNPTKFASVMHAMTNSGASLLKTSIPVKNDSWKILQLQKKMPRDELFFPYTI